MFNVFFKTEIEKGQNPGGDKNTKICKNNIFNFFIGKFVFLMHINANLTFRLPYKHVNCAHTSIIYQTSH